MKKVLLVLLAILLVFAFAAGTGYGIAWYQSNHIFIGEEAYPLDSAELDLREISLSFQEYEDIQAQLPDCYILWSVPFQGSTYSSDSTKLTLSTVNREDLDLIHRYFPEIREVDAEGCTDYALLQQFQAEAPHCDVIYSVDLGGTAFPLDTTEVTLAAGEYDYSVLTENLVYLPQLTTMNLTKPELTLEQIDALKASYADIAIHCTVEILGQEYDTETTELNLSSLTSADIAAVTEKLGMLPNLARIELVGADGTSKLGKAEAKALMDAAPQAIFNYSFEFFGQTLSSSTEEVILKNVKIGDENEAEVRLALDLLPNCKRLVLDNCSLSDEVLAEIRDDYRDQTKVVWRVWFGVNRSSVLTDVDILRITYDLRDSNCQDLIYCEDVVYIDAGHNDTGWWEIPFVAGMPKLEVCIISGSHISDLTPFANCPKLRVLEAAFCERLEDLSPLANCKELTHLNIANTHALDLSPLDDLPLTNLIHCLNPGGGSRLSIEEQERFMAQHPNCYVEFKSSQPYGVGWRYDTDNKTHLDWYAEMRRQLRLNDATVLNNVGWYLLPPEENS